MPRASVVMPVYNALPYLKEAVDSLLTQTFADIEILALDDESTDGSGEFLESIDDPRMRVFRCEKQGVVRLRNKGLNLARGQYYVVMDADDVSAPLRIERQVGKQTPEPPGSPGLHQSRSSNGSVSPRSSSSRASRAIRRITSRFPAKRVFQASSSANEARICDAIASCSSWGSATTFSSAFSNNVDMPHFYRRIRRTAMPRPGSACSGGVFN